MNSAQNINSFLDGLFIKEMTSFENNFCFIDWKGGEAIDQSA